MRKVVSKSEVAHMWANQHQDEARVSGGNFYFYGATIFSYGSHFPIASFDKKDSDVVFFTTDGYSHTTSKHIYEVMHACSHKTRINCKEPLEAREGRHTINIEDFERRAKAQAMKLPRSRKPEIYLNEIERIRGEFEKYVKHCKVAKSRYKKLKYVFIKSKDGGIEATAKEIKANAREKKRREKETLAMNKQQVEDFLSFERHRISARLDRDYIRYNQNTERFETSQAVEIPLIAAQRFYNWIKTTLADGGCDGECTESIMNYQVSTVGEDVVKIGCHTIDTKHMLEVGGSIFGG